MKKFRCAIIGCGRIGCGFDYASKDGIIRTHAGAYFHNSKTKLVALCDVDQSKLIKYGKKYNVESLYTNSFEMFQNEKIDCLSICTLVDSHLKLVKEAIENGVKGIFLEKPMSDTLKNAKSIIDLCKKEKISLLIDHKRRFDPFYESVRKLILEKKLGSVQLINVYYGAGVSNTGSHLFDLIRFFFGDVISVKSNSSKNVSNNPNDPNIDAVLELHQKIECKIHALNYNPYAIFEMDILGTDGRIRLNLISNKIEYFKVRNDKYFVYRDLSPSKIKVAASNPSPLLLAVQNMVNSIDKMEEPKCSGFDGYKSLELIIACIESARNQKKLFLPLVNNNYKINSK